MPEWLDRGIAKYGAKDENGKPKYEWGAYNETYKQDSVNGTMDKDGNGAKEIDCSHLANAILRDAGFNIDYVRTSELLKSGYFDVVTGTPEVAK